MVGCANFRLGSFAQTKTVKTVSCALAQRNTRLKPGENERSSLREVYLMATGARVTNRRGFGPVALSHFDLTTSV
jgi:hypothetical protein